MKRILTVALCALGFLLIAAPIYMNQPTNPVLLNGKRFANAVTINGNLYISLEDFAKAAGGTLTLEQAGFKLQGNTLTANTPASFTIKGNVQASAAPNTIGTPAIKGEGQVAHKHIGANQLFQVRKAGGISNGVVIQGGKTWLPLADVAKAFGGTFTAPGNLKPGDTISLNFAVNGDGILAVQQ